MSWPAVEFGEVATIVTGSTPKKVEGNYDGDVPFVTPGDLGIHAEITHSNSTVTEKGAKSGRLLRKGAVLVCCIGATIGKVGIAARDLITNQQINSLVFDESKVFPKFGYYFCISIKPLLIARSSSTTMPIVNKSNFSKLEMPLPPLDEQKRIAAILDKADSVRRKRQQATELADDFLRNVFLDMFGDPVSNPKGWECKKWADVLRIVNGKNQKAVASDDGQYPIMGSGGEMGRAIDFLTPENSVIIGRKGNINKPILVKEKFWNVDTAFGLVPDRDFISHNYLYWFCVFFNFEKLNKTVTIPSLTKADLLEVNIPLPTLKLIEKFDQIVEKVSDLHLKNAINGLQANKMFNALSQKAFSGQL